MSSTAFLPSVIFNLIDHDEFFRLDDKEREWIALMLGGNTVNLVEDGPSLSKLYEFFPSGATRTAIDDLLYVIGED